jgi:hypothetical protein
MFRVLRELKVVRLDENSLQEIRRDPTEGFFVVCVGHETGNLKLNKIYFKKIVSCLLMSLTHKSLYKFSSNPLKPYLKRVVITGLGISI